MLARVGQFSNNRWLNTLLVLEQNFFYKKEYPSCIHSYILYFRLGSSSQHNCKTPDFSKGSEVDTYENEYQTCIEQTIYELEYEQTEVKNNFNT